MSKTYYLLYTIPFHYQTYIQCHSKSHRPILPQCKGAFQIQCTSDGPLKMLVSNNQVWNSHKMYHQYGITGCWVFKQRMQNWKKICIKINIPKGNYWILRIGIMGRCQKKNPLGMLIFRQKSFQFCTLTVRWYACKIYR